MDIKGWIFTRGKQNWRGLCTKFYKVYYKEDNTIERMEPLIDGIPQIINKRIIKDLDKSYYPEK